MVKPLISREELLKRKKAQDLAKGIGGKGSATVTSVDKGTLVSAPSLQEGKERQILINKPQAVEKTTTQSVGKDAPTRWTLQTTASGSFICVKDPNGQFATSAECMTAREAGQQQQQQQKTEEFTAEQVAAAEKTAKEKEEELKQLEEQRKKGLRGQIETAKEAAELKIEQQQQQADIAQRQAQAQAVGLGAFGATTAAAQAAGVGAREELGRAQTVAEFNIQQINTTRDQQQRIIQKELARGEKADAEKILNAQTALKEADIQLQRETIAAEEGSLVAVVEAAGDTLGTMTDEELDALADEHGISSNLLKLKRDNIALQTTTQQQQVEAAEIKSRDTVITSMISGGALTGLTTEQISNISQGSSFTPGDLALFQKRQEEINKMDAVERVGEQAKLNAEIANKKASTQKAVVETQKILSEVTGSTALTNVPTALGSTTMIDSVGKFGVIPSLEGTDTSKIGNGNIIIGSDFTDGLDIDGFNGQELLAPTSLVGGKIKELNTGVDEGGFGTNIVIEDERGREWRFSHLQEGSLKGLSVGSDINQGDNIGKIGTTGRVFPGPNGGDGSHVDISVEELGIRLNAQNVEQILNLGSRAFTKLNTEELKERDTQVKSFTANPDVKAFNEASSQARDLVSSMNQAGGAGDMAGIFQFMKTLDPASVVRESEFKSAASTSGAADWRNMLDVLNEGDLLTPTQRVNFKKLAKQFIANKARDYNEVYDEHTNRLKRQRIPVSQFVTNRADSLLKQLNITTTEFEGVSNEDFLSQGQQNNSSFFGGIQFTATGREG